MATLNLFSCAHFHKTVNIECPTNFECQFKVDPHLLKLLLVLNSIISMSRMPSRRQQLLMFVRFVLC
jgi:hypothetical protein